MKVWVSCGLIVFLLSPYLQILFVHIDTSDETAERIMEFFNIKEADTPSSRLINLEEDMRKYVPDFNEITSEKLIPFIEAYLAGELKVCRGKRDVYLRDYTSTLSLSLSLSLL